jgi:hypothetical protein
MTRLRLRRAAAALSLLLGVTVAALALAQMISARQDRPAVVALGSGDGLSVLITAGGARLLIPAGDQPSAFGNAWRAWAVVPLTRRVDLLALPGDGDPVASSAMRMLTVRETISLPGGDAGSTGSPGATPLEDALRVQVGDAVAITLERSSDRTNLPATWRLVVERGATRLAILPEGSAAARFAWPQPVAALVLLRGPAGDAVRLAGAAAVIVPDRISGKTLRTEVPVPNADGFWARRVSPGEVTRLDLTADGLRLPDDADWYDGGREEDLSGLPPRQSAAPQKGQRSRPDTAGVPQT